jgi:hypothetical protein
VTSADVKAAGGAREADGTVLLTAPSMDLQAQAAAPPASPDSVVQLESSQRVHSLAKHSARGNEGYFKEMEPAALFGNRRRKERLICEVKICISRYPISSCHSLSLTV